jgi:hypothetical protein
VTISHILRHGFAKTDLTFTALKTWLQRQEQAHPAKTLSNRLDERNLNAQYTPSPLSVCHLIE